MAKKKNGFVNRGSINFSIVRYGNFYTSFVIGSILRHNRIFLLMTLDKNLKFKRTIKKSKEGGRRQLVKLFKNSN